MKSSFILLFAASVMLCSFHNIMKPVLKLQRLRCELLQDPLAIDITKPGLSWEIESNQRGIEQVAYQVLVASSIENLDRNKADLWNSGKVFSDQSVHVLYAGKPLKSRASCFWKVKVWTKDQDSAGSSPAKWSMGLLNKTDW